ncbi:hypothetical protein U9M48_011302 [Paspalum notatum var. saurae]|uniref:Uncharacterized protein n=1 Tax=Paspalum notatum var. saurae TaxID=547442 RepID=A0AAQ3WH11_PASNO
MWLLDPEVGDQEEHERERTSRGAPQILCLGVVPSHVPIFTPLWTCGVRTVECPTLERAP